MKKIYLLVTALALTLTTHTYRRDDFAIGFIGGLNSIYGQPNNIACAIRTAYPDIPFVEFKIGDGSQEATRYGIYHQLGQLYSFALETTALKDKHLILIGGSQGGLLAESFVKMYGDKLPFTIDSLMTIASPLDGQYGLPDDWETIVDTVVMQGDSILLQKIAGALGIKDMLYTIADEKNATIESALTDETVTRDIITSIRKIIAKTAKSLIKKNISLITLFLYNPLALDLFSVAGYWRDPFHRLDYLAFNHFLPIINNEREHADSARYKANIEALNHIVYFWAGQDNVVKPACSGSMCFYKWGSTTAVEATFKETLQYQENLLGLGTMYDEGRLVIELLPNDTHSCDSADAINAGLHQFATIVNDTREDKIAAMVIGATNCCI